jgi:hypothetical protein
MNAVRAVWKNGQILPEEPINWPEGSKLIVEPVVRPESNLGLTEADWHDDPASIAAWEAAVRIIEPPEYSDDERVELARFRKQSRQHNLEAVRRQMEAGGPNDPTLFAGHWDRSRLSRTAPRRA